MDLKNNIKIFGALKKLVNALYAIITVIRVVSVIFLVLQAIFLITEDGKSFSIQSAVKHFKA
ncbi:MAG: hypothetical protein HFJ99_08600 [Eubacterium sp.]|jgi:hypothetical protein|nr:hypothetical protein [Eubacterium sp.]